MAAVAAYYKRIFEKKHLLIWALIHDACKKGRGREAHLIIRTHLLGLDHIKRTVVALKAKISAISWSAQDTKKKFPWYAAEHASFQSKATHLEKTTMSYRGLSAEAKMRHFLGGIKGRELGVFLAVICNDAVMKVNFSKASTYLLNYIHNDSRFKKTRHISGVGL